MILIPWKRFEVLFHNLPFSPIYIIDLSSDLINFKEIIINFLISLWIRPLFTIIPLNSRYFHQIGNFGLCFDTRLCEIDDLMVSARQQGRSFVRCTNGRQKWDGSAMSGRTRGPLGKERDGRASRIRGEDEARRSKHA